MQRLTRSLKTLYLARALILLGAAPEAGIKIAINFKKKEKKEISCIIKSLSHENKEGVDMSISSKSYILCVSFHIS